MNAVKQARYELLSSTRFDPFLSSLKWNNDKDGACPFFLLPYHLDRLLHAAEKHDWEGLQESLDYSTMKESCLAIVRDCQAHDSSQSAFRVFSCSILNFVGLLKSEWIDSHNGLKIGIYICRLISNPSIGCRPHVCIIFQPIDRQCNTVWTRCEPSYWSTTYIYFSVHGNENHQPCALWGCTYTEFYTSSPQSVRYDIGCYTLQRWRPYHWNHYLQYRYIPLTILDYTCSIVRMPKWRFETMVDRTGPDSWGPGRYFE